jgi:putative acetyltransferase
MSLSNEAGAELVLRPATAADTQQIIALVDSVYREYGDRICLDDADSDLLTAHDHYARLGGEFVVLAGRDCVRGIHAVVPLADRSGVCTFRRLYLDPALRGSGAGEQLMRWALDRAREMNFQRVEFWSDTRFSRAHRFFKRLGFQPDGRVREMHDAWTPYQEYFFYQDL